MVKFICLPVRDVPVRGYDPDHGIINLSAAAVVLPNATLCDSVSTLLLFIP